MLIAHDGNFFELGASLLSSLLLWSCLLHYLLRSLLLWSCLLHCLFLHWHKSMTLVIDARNKYRGQCHHEENFMTLPKV